MATHESSGKLVFKKPQIKIRPTNTEDVKAIIEQRKRNGGRSRKDPPSATVTPTLLDEYGRDRYGREILNAYLRKADVSPDRLADPNENIDDIIAEVVKAKYGVGLAELPTSADMDNLLKLESLELNKCLDAPQEQGELEKYDPKLAMHEIITSLDGKLYHVELASPQETKKADSDEEAASSHPVNSDSGGFTVLEVLCGDGVWCNQLQLEHPTWIVKGIDRVASPAWAQFDSALSVASAEDISAVRKEVKDGKNKVKDPSDANKPLFVVFPIPSVTGLPIPVQTYDFIRGRDIFATTHDWKLLLDDLHKILKLGGAIELIELDPRPRSFCAGFLQLTEEGPGAPYGKSAGVIFPETFEDRLKEALDPSLLQESSPWMNHVLHCLGYSSMPERIYATEVKSWVEASGFCGVKEEIIKVPVGDWMEDPKLKALGERMLKHLSSQVKNKLDLATTSRGEYDSILEDMMNSKTKAYVNLHIITGRKPDFPRIGDLMPDNTRYRIAGAANRDHLTSCDETLSWNITGEHSS